MWAQHGQGGSRVLSLVMWALPFSIVCATNTILACGIPWLLSGEYGDVSGKCMCYVGETLGQSGEFCSVFGELPVFLRCLQLCIKIGSRGAIQPVDQHNIFNVLNGGRGGARLHAGGVGQHRVHSLEHYEPPPRASCGNHHALQAAAVGLKHWCW